MSTTAPAPTRRARRARGPRASLVTVPADTLPEIPLAGRPAPAEGVAVVAAGSRQGARRDENQDVALVHGPLLAVADGVGGRPGGGRAAVLATDALAEAMSAPSAGAGRALAAAFGEANGRVRDDAAGRGLEGMASTLVATHVARGTLTVAHVGDSPAYLWRDGRLRRLTEAHTLGRAYAARGGADRALDPSLAGAIVRAVGLGPRIEPEVRRLDVRAGDVLVLCSDGVSGPLGEEGIAAVLGASPDPVAAGTALLDAATSTGGDDATAIVARLG